jgi:mannose-6-phosphate isomerase-like protein (cupin superfamily)
METINGASIYRGAADPVTVDGAETHGTYSMLLGTLPHDDSPPDHHLHPHTDELFYIAHGEMTFHVGDRTFTASSGTAVFVPRGVAHTAWVSGDRPMRGLLVLSPGDAEHIFEPVEEPT